MNNFTIRVPCDQPSENCNGYGIDKSLIRNGWCTCWRCNSSKLMNVDVVIKSDEAHTGMTTPFYEDALILKSKGEHFIVVHAPENKRTSFYKDQRLKKDEFIAEHFIDIV